MKGVIIAAGYGTRFLPVTKTIPKEMLPLINKPSIDFIVEEFINSGITDILIVSSRRKKTLEDYFDREAELESVFLKENKNDKLNTIKPFNANFFFVRQQEMKGTGHALLLTRSFIGDEPFIVAYPDDLHFGEKPLCRQMIEKHEKTGCSVLATIHNPPNLNRYGLIAIKPGTDYVTGIIEKPEKGKEPSKEATIGRYLFTPEIFKYLEEGYKKHTSGEFYHIHAILELCRRNKVVYHQVEGLRLDTGEPAGYLRAILEYAMKDEELKEIIKEYTGQ